MDFRYMDPAIFPILLEHLCSACSLCGVRTQSNTFCAQCEKRACWDCWVFDNKKVIFCLLCFEKLGIYEIRKDVQKRLDWIKNQSK